MYLKRQRRYIGVATKSHSCPVAISSLDPAAPPADEASASCTSSCAQTGSFRARSTSVGLTDAHVTCPSYFRANWAPCLRQHQEICLWVSSTLFIYFSFYLFLNCLWDVFYYLFWLFLFVILLSFLFLFICSILIFCLWVSSTLFICFFFLFSS